MNRSGGFTLVEVMVAALMLLLATAGALSMVAQGRRAHRAAEAQARMEEGARAALDLLAYELRMAGYAGRQPPGSAVAGASPVGASAAPGLETAGACVASLAVDLGSPIAGADAEYAARPGVPLGCAPSPAGRWVPGSDTLVLRRASVVATPLDPGRLQWETTRQGGRLFADGEQRLQGSQVNDLEVSAYYVSADSTGRNGWPSLRRKRLVGGSAAAFQDEELVPGIADLQVEALVDPDSLDPGQAAGYLPLSAVPAAARIRSLRIWVLMQGDLPEGGSIALPGLSYANRILPPTQDRRRRLLASRSVAPRNLPVRP